MTTQTGSGFPFRSGGPLKIAPIGRISARISASDKSRAAVEFETAVTSALLDDDMNGELEERGDGESNQKTHPAFRGHVVF